MQPRRADRPSVCCGAGGWLSRLRCSVGGLRHSSGRCSAVFAWHVLGSPLLGNAGGKRRGWLFAPRPLAVCSAAAGMDGGARGRAGEPEERARPPTLAAVFREARTTAKGQRRCFADCIPTEGGRPSSRADGVERDCCFQKDAGLLECPGIAGQSGRRCLYKSVRPLPSSVRRASSAHTPTEPYTACRRRFPRRPAGPPAGPPAAPLPPPRRAGSAAWSWRQRGHPAKTR